jgi:60 kDa SS-A/Ro ribonucleoprotein
VGQSSIISPLEAYRKLVNPHAKLVCCAVAANHANVVDPMDPLSFGVAGLDANVASLVAEFIGR